MYVQHGVYAESALSPPPHVNHALAAGSPGPPGAFQGSMLQSGHPPWPRSVAGGDFASGLAAGGCGSGDHARSSTVPDAISHEEAGGFPPPPSGAASRPPRASAGSGGPGLLPRGPSAIPTSGNTNAAVIVSVGTIGHPDDCAEACPYVKRKGGCKDGARCPKCHMCFWQRTAVRMAQSSQQQAQQPQQTGSNELPMEEPLFVPPMGGIIGAVPAASPGIMAAASDVLMPPPMVQPQAVPPQVPPPAAMAAAWGADEPPSVGSIGHPHSCGPACKYSSKGRGCKDGRVCLRCHLCQWRRFSA